MIDATQLKIGAVFLGRSGTRFNLAEIIKIRRPGGDVYCFNVIYPNPALGRIEMEGSSEKVLAILNSDNCELL